MNTTTAVSQSRAKSKEVYEKCCRFIPKGVNSPVRAFPGLNQTPLVAHSGYGDLIRDIDDNSYIDLCCSWGALIHGHAHPKIVEAAQRRVAQGSSFGLTTEIEALLAAKIVEHVPSVEKVRFVSSGTEATMSAIRLARGFTKRDLIVKFSGHYHGHADSFLVQAGSGALNLSSSAGVPQDFVDHTLCIPFNDFEACSNLFKNYGSKIAAVILEPIAANMGIVFPKSGFLQMLREETRKYGALLIFDEVITGFRVGLGGAQELFKVSPDLTCFGKIIGGGFPAAAFGGSNEIMELLAPSGPVYQAGTLSGNPVAMEAGYQTILLCETPGFYQALEEKTSLITRSVKSRIEEEGLAACVHQAGSLFTIFFGKTEITDVEDVKQCDPEKFADFFHGLFQKGVYVSPSQFEANFISYAHTVEHLNYTRDVILNVLNSKL